MYSNNDKISIPQMVNVIILNMVGIGVLTLPRRLIEEAGTDGWLVLILGGMAAVAVAFGHGYIVKNFPGKSFFQILSLTLTKPIAYIVGLYTLVHFIGITSYVTRIFGMIVKEFLLEQTPPAFVILPILLISAYLVRGGVEVLGRLAEAVIVPLSVIIFLLFAVSWQNIEVANLLPIFQTSPMRIIQAIPFVLFSFLGFEVLLILGGFLDKPIHSTKVGPIAIVVVILIYMVLNASVLGVLGERQTEALIWPLISTFKTIDLPGAFIENVEIFIMTVWIFIAFMTIAPFHLGASLLMMDMASSKDHGYYALLPVPLIAMISIWDDSVAEVYESLRKLSDYTAYGVVILVPLGILISIFIRRRRKKGDQGG